MADRFKKRADLIGREGTITKSFTIIDVKEYPTGVDVRVSDSTGEEYWTGLEDIDLYE